MASQSSDIESLVRVVVEPLVEDKEALSVTSSVAADGTQLVEIRVNPEDVGKVIGRQGRVIKSIRVLARAAVCAEGGDVEVELIED